jgi:hypothetical protein
LPFGAGLGQREAQRVQGNAIVSHFQGVLFKCDLRSLEQTREKPRGDLVKDLHTLKARGDARPPKRGFGEQALKIRPLLTHRFIRKGNVTVSGLLKKNLG